MVRQDILSIIASGTSKQLIRLRLDIGNIREVDSMGIFTATKDIRKLELIWCKDYVVNVVMGSGLDNLMKVV
jgi:hypothetical protein